MKTIIAVLSVCLFVASCQAQNRPPPPPGSTQSAPAASQRPPRPKGCSPGCGNTEICAELGSSYCRGGTSCSVCIKMSSIRFPASALAGMFQQQKQQEQVQPQATVPAQQIPVQLPANNPFPTGQEEVSIMELASRQQQIQEKIANEMAGQGATGIPPRPPPVDESKTVRPVNEIDPVILPLNDASVPPTPNPFVKTAVDVKYPIVATVHEPLQPIHEASVVLDQNQLDQIHQQYQQGNVESTLTPQEKTKAEFDFASFKRYQDWLKLQQVPSGVSSAAEDFALFQKYRQWVQMEEQTKQSQIPVDTSASSTNILPTDPPANAVDSSNGNTATTTLPPFDFAAFKQQFQQEAGQTQGATGAIVPQTGQTSTAKETNYLDYATIQRMWQEQQQQQQQQELANQAYHVHHNTPNDFSYQPAVNTYNDPFGDLFGFNEPVPQQQNQLQNNMHSPMNNNMFGLMMFEGLGFGGGFGLGF